MHTTLITIPIVHQAYPNLLQLPKSHISNHFTPFILINFTPILIFAIWGSFHAETYVGTKDRKFLLLSSPVYAKLQFSISNSCNKFREKNKFKSAQDSTSSQNVCRTGKPSKNLKVILESIKFRQLRVRLDCLNCLFGVFPRNRSLFFSDFLHDGR